MSLSKTVYFLRDYIAREMVWVWLLWLVSQAWVTVHAWQPRCERVAATDKLFAKPWYVGPLVDQSLLLYRTKDEDNELQLEVPSHHLCCTEINDACGYYNKCHSFALLSIFFFQLNS